MTTAPHRIAGECGECGERTSAGTFECYYQRCAANTSKRIVANLMGQWGFWANMASPFYLETIWLSLGPASLLRHPLAARLCIYIRS